ncbi:MAG: hypothetical protein IIB76_06115 [Proteobacteria bacterium]|nr:hypothetical protein [Pseudomonadota bacterium]
MRIATIFLAVILLQIPGLIFSGDSVAAGLQTSSFEIEVVFSTDEIRIIRAHYDSQSGNSHRGKGKHKGLPPGIAKNLARGKPLPPGIAKRSLPYDLIRALPPVMDGHERIIVAGKILLIEIATHIIIDVLSDVLLD